jgi:TonB family protein
LGDSFLRTTGIPLATESLLSELDRCAQDPDVQPQTPLTQSHESVPQSRPLTRQSQDSVTLSSPIQPVAQSTVRPAEISLSASTAATGDVPIGVLEVPIGLWGSRRGAFISGESGRIEVFAEETSTVIVFPHGAVIRLSAAVAPGQMMMITNRNTNQVAACRVVKSRNYPNAKGYAEVEFFRPTIDFWGGYVPQGTMTLSPSPAPEKLAQDFWSSGYTPEMINVLSNVSTASPVPFPAARNKTRPIGSPPKHVPRGEKLAQPETLTLTPVLVQATPRNAKGGERSWIRDFLSSLPGQVVALSGADRNYSPKPRMAFAWVTVTCLLITVVGTGFYLRQRGAVQLAGTAEINAMPESSAASSTANAAENAQSAAPAVPLVAKTENFPGSQVHEFGYGARASQPAAKASSLERKMSNGKPFAAPSIAHHSTVIGKEMPPNVPGMNSTTGTAKTPGIFAALMSPGGRVKEAQLVSESAPNYPTIAKQAGVEGEVTVSAVIDITGKLTNMKIVSGPPMLQQAALDSLRTWKYEPAFLNDKPVPVQTSITVKFRIR